MSRDEIEKNNNSIQDSRPNALKLKE